jgi:hypothetical protein
MGSEEFAKMGSEEFAKMGSEEFAKMGSEEFLDDLDAFRGFLLFFYKF